MKLNQISQRCLEIFGTIRTIQLQGLQYILGELEDILNKSEKMTINDKGEKLVSMALTEKEVHLLSSLVTIHIRRLEGLVEEQPATLPTHKQWMYDLEDKLEDL